MSLRPTAAAWEPPAHVEEQHTSADAADAGAPPPQMHAPALHTAPRAAMDDDEDSCPTPPDDFEPSGVQGQDDREFTAEEQAMQYHQPQAPHQHHQHHMQQHMQQQYHAQYAQQQAQMHAHHHQQTQPQSAPPQEHQAAGETQEGEGAAPAAATSPELTEAHWDPSQHPGPNCPFTQAEVEQMAKAQAEHQAQVRDTVEKSTFRASAKPFEPPRAANGHPHPPCLSGPPPPPPNGAHLNDGFLRIGNGAYDEEAERAKTLQGPTLSSTVERKKHYVKQAVQQHRKDLVAMKSGLEAFSNAVLHSVSPFMQPLRAKTRTSLPHIKMDQRYGRRGQPHTAVMQFLIAPIVPNYRPTHFHDLAPGDAMEYHHDLALVLGVVKSASCLAISYGAEWKPYALPYAYLSCSQYQEEVKKLCPEEVPNTRSDAVFEDDVTKDVTPLLLSVPELKVLRRKSFVNCLKQRDNIFALYAVFADLFKDVPNYQIQIRDLHAVPCKIYLKTNKAALGDKTIRIAGDPTIWHHLKDVLPTFGSGKVAVDPSEVKTPAAAAAAAAAPATSADAAKVPGAAAAAAAAKKHPHHHGKGKKEGAEDEYDFSDDSDDSEEEEVVVKKKRSKAAASSGIPIVAVVVGATALVAAAAVIGAAVTVAALKKSQ